MGRLASRREIDGTVQVVAYLPEQLARALRTATADRYRLTAVRSAVQFEALLAWRPFDLAFVDPCGSGQPGAAVLAPMLARYPRLPVVLYTRLSADTPRHALQLAVPHLVLAGVDDAPGALVRLIDALTADPIAERLLPALEPGLARLAPPFREAVIRLVTLRVVRGCSRQSLHRALRRAGLPPPGVLIRAVRVMRALRYVGSGHARVASVARWLGYQEPRRFSEHFSAMTGYAPSRVPREMSTATLVARVMGRVGIEPTSVRL
jgi:AraC-like DNA-binding protein